jgi:hypothetical protein
MFLLNYTVDVPENPTRDSSEEKAFHNPDTSVDREGE